MRAERQILPFSSQRGAVLLVTLVMLLLVTLLAVSMLKTSTLDMKAATTNTRADEAFNQAESTAQDFVNKNSHKLGPGVTPELPVTPEGTSINVQQMACGESYFGTSLEAADAMYFDVQVRSGESGASSATVRQGYMITVPEGTCT